jgi:hypothetical protein
MRDYDTLNTGQPWSERELRDLRQSIEDGEPVLEIADFLCRTPQEVIDKAKELGFDLSKV